jgi:hypothetical protein
VEGGSGGSKGLNGGLPVLFLGDGEGFIQSAKQHQAPSKSTQRRVITLGQLRSNHTQKAKVIAVALNRIHAQKRQATFAVHIPNFQRCTF